MTGRGAELAALALSSAGPAFREARSAVDQRGGVSHGAMAEGLASHSSFFWELPC
jgi:hypothetical protein